MEMSVYMASVCVLKADISWDFMGSSLVCLQISQLSMKELLTVDVSR